MKGKQRFNAGPFEDALQMPIPEMVTRRISQKALPAQPVRPEPSKASRP